MWKHEKQSQTQENMTVSNTHSIGKMKHRNQHETVFKSVKIVRKT